MPGLSGSGSGSSCVVLFFRRFLEVKDTLECVVLVIDWSSKDESIKLLPYYSSNWMLYLGGAKSENFVCYFD